MSLGAGGVCAIALDVVILGRTPTAGVANDAAKVVETGSSVVVHTAADWKSDYPDVYASFMRNEENDQAEQYPEIYAPYFSLFKIYEGNKFGSDYAEARGHSYTLIDVSKTERPHPQAKCITCKSPDFHALVNAEGNGVYTRDFAEVMAQMNEAVSCYS